MEIEFLKHMEPEFTCCQCTQHIYGDDIRGTFWISLDNQDPWHGSERFRHAEVCLQFPFTAEEYSKGDYTSIPRVIRCRTCGAIPYRIIKNPFYR